MAGRFFLLFLFYKHTNGHNCSEIVGTIKPFTPVCCFHDRDITLYENQKEINIIICYYFNNGKRTLFAD